MARAGARWAPSMQGFSPGLCPWRQGDEGMELAGSQKDTNLSACVREQIKAPWGISCPDWELRERQQWAKKLLENVASEVLGSG